MKDKNKELLNKQFLQRIFENIGMQLEMIKTGLEYVPKISEEETSRIYKEYESLQESVNNILTLVEEKLRDDLFKK